MFVRTYILTTLDSGFLFKSNYGTAVTYMPIFELAQSYDWHQGGVSYNTLKEVARLQVTN